MFLIVIALQFSLADSLFIHRDYELARIEYLREFFFFPDHYADEGKRVAFAVSSLQIDTLAGLYELAKLTADLPEITQQSRITIASYYIKLNRTSKARSMLNSTDETRLFGYTYLIDGNLLSAREYFLSLGDTCIAHDINTFLQSPRKSMQTATLLSIVCPGAGEIYAGNLSLGIKDFILNAGSIFLLYNAMRKKKYVDGLLVFNFLFHRFYVGSIYNAQKTILEAHEDQYEDWMEYMNGRYFQYNNGFR